MNNLNASTNLYYGEWCAYRLPCGLCEKLKEQCPKQNAINYCSGGADMRERKGDDD